MGLVRVLIKAPLNRMAHLCKHVVLILMREGVTLRGCLDYPNRFFKCFFIVEFSVFISITELAVLALNFFSLLLSKAFRNFLDALCQGVPELCL